MKPGPRPQPSKVIDLKGGRKHTHRPMNKNEPAPEAKAPPMPEGLDDVAKAEWKRMAPVLERLGVLTEIDHGMFEAMCLSYSDWVKYSKMAQDRPIVKSEKTGYIQVSPFITLADKSLKAYMKLAVEFGLTPSSRSRIHAAPVKGNDNNPWENL